MSDTLRISDLASRSGFNLSALRYYERVGLLEAADRSPGGYRLFGPEVLDRLRFIERAKQLGLDLGEIRQLVEVWDDGVCAEVQARLRDLIVAKSLEVRNRIEQLTDFSAELDRALDELATPAEAGACESGCGCADPRPGAAAAPDLADVTGPRSPRRPRAGCTPGVTALPATRPQGQA